MLCPQTDQAMAIVFDFIEIRVGEDAIAFAV